MLNPFYISRDSSLRDGGEKPLPKERQTGRYVTAKLFLFLSSYVDVSMELFTRPSTNSIFSQDLLRESGRRTDQC